PGYYVLIGVLSVAILVRTLSSQLYDTNYYVLWEATALLAGDHPYRDFYLIGWPLLTGISTLVQWLVGYRLIGEFVLQWAFITAGMVIGFHLAVGLSRSVWASLVTSVLAMIALAA